MFAIDFSREHISILLTILCPKRFRSPFLKTCNPMLLGLKNSIKIMTRNAAPNKLRLQLRERHKRKMPCAINSLNKLKSITNFVSSKKLSPHIDKQMKSFTTLPNTRSWTMDWELPMNMVELLSSIGSSKRSQACMLMPVKNWPSISIRSCKFCWINTNRTKELQNWFRTSLAIWTWTPWTCQESFLAKTWRSTL